MKFSTFLLASLVVLVLCVLAAVALTYNTASETQTATAIGVGLGFLNALLGFAILSWGYHKSNRHFMASFMGGMIFRFLLIFLSLFVLIRALKISELPLVISLVATYFIYLILEVFIIYWNSKQTEAERGIE